MAEVIRIPGKFVPELDVGYNSRDQNEIKGPSPMT